MPTRPCAEAGFWIDPPVSSARPNTARLAPTAVAVPALYIVGDRDIPIVPILVNTYLPPIPTPRRRRR